MESMLISVSFDCWSLSPASHAVTLDRFRNPQCSRQRYFRAFPISWVHRNATSAQHRISDDSIDSWLVLLGTRSS